MIENKLSGLKICLVYNEEGHYVYIFISALSDIIICTIITIKVHATLLYPREFLKLKNSLHPVTFAVFIKVLLLYAQNNVL